MDTFSLYLYRSRIGIGGLENERISEELTRLIAGLKMVEDFLPDYMRTGNQLTRNNMGLFMLNTQWGNEELQRGLALGSILELTGCKTRDQIIKEQQESLTRVWEPPFFTSRQIVAHAAFQERGTHLAYEALHRKAEAENASNVAQILRLISADEVYHGVGYQLVTQVYHEIDPEGTIEDIFIPEDIARKTADEFLKNDNDFCTVSSDRTVRISAERHYSS